MNSSLSALIILYFDTVTFFLFCNIKTKFTIMCMYHTIPIINKFVSWNRVLLNKPIIA